VSHIAVFLQEVCPEPGGRVAAMLPNIPEFPLLWLAAARSGRVLVPINCRGKRTDTAHLLRDSGAVVAITVPALQGVLQEAADDVDGPLRVMLIEELPAHETQIQGVVQEAGEPVRTVNIQYTSGTTGLPKGCLLSHSYWLTIARSLCESFPHIDTNDVLYTAQPFSYMDPQWNVVTAMLAGARLVVADRFSARAMWRDVREQRVTVFYCLGMMPAAMLAQPAHPDDRNHHVRAILASGIPPELHETLERRWGVPWFEAFGMTESGADLIVAPADHDATVGAGCIGRPHPGKEALVVGLDGEPVAAGQHGELVLRGVGMMDGYWRHPQATAQVFRNGWLRTGDRARVDEDGLFFYLGRFKDMVRRSGENVSAHEVESVLEEHPAVRTAAVVSEPDAMVGEEVKVFLISSGGKEPDLPSLVTYCHTRLASFKVPRYWCIRQTLPMTPSERVAKGELRADDGPVWDAKTGHRQSQEVYS
jgi:crotonobetaine/carnitine-CoA ligase